MSAEENLKKLGITLPEPPSPLGAYLPFRRSGKLIFLSGVLPLVNGKLISIGKVGLDLSVEEGFEASKIACLNALSILKAELGNLDKVNKIVKVTGFVGSAAFFNEHPKVVNGASELLYEVFGEKGKHARVAVGCISLPLDSPVEIEMIVEVKEE